MIWYIIDIWKVNYLKVILNEPTQNKPHFNIALSIQWEWESPDYGYHTNHLNKKSAVYKTDRCKWSNGATVHRKKYMLTYLYIYF